MLVAELEAFRVKVTASANETFGAWRERDHDDLVLATALAAWAGELALPYEGPVGVPKVLGGFEEWASGESWAEYAVGSPVVNQRSLMHRSRTNFEDCLSRGAIECLADGFFHACEHLGRKRPYRVTASNDVSGSVLYTRHRVTTNLWLDEILQRDQLKFQPEGRA